MRTVDSGRLCGASRNRGRDEHLEDAWIRYPRVRSRQSCVGELQG